MVADTDSKELREAMADFVGACTYAGKRAKAWGKKAHHILGSKRSFIVHEEDGTPLAVMVVLQQPAPYSATYVYEAWDWAYKLNLPLSIVAGEDSAVNIPRTELSRTLDLWRPYVGPDGFILDFTRNVEETAS
jgi:hypothetical protein